ncbi:hypothetical protein [Azospirillum griseum]|nr:hypothetical protein [Azospirillum griseum]
MAFKPHTDSARSCGRITATATATAITGERLQRSVQALAGIKRLDQTTLP